ncbi:MAG: riboflavin synthase subunit alpha [Elusimicrobia bacterium RIFOXYB2_FULL_49_7]|nr:MAG: riboflavin synthase subunit alpha [Elusimicrobia bacterium RIFOXYB2_FULL_49_7]
MFTGIIEEIGTLKSVTHRNRGRELFIACQTILSDLKPGDSVSTDGVCLTAEKVAVDGFIAFASPETIDRSTLKEARPGLKINLERALRLSDRLGGHLVSGHVDTTAVILRDERKGESLERTLRIDGPLSRQIAEKGSITLDGISLTVARKNGNEITVALIPETLKRTVFAEKPIGNRMNVETDQVAKYIESLLSADRTGLTEHKLKEYGF